MLNKSLLVAAIVAFTPAVAFATPLAVKAAPATMTSTVKHGKVTAIKHHAAKKQTVKTRMKLHAKPTMIKS
jgi:hypothetical protein